MGAKPSEQRPEDAVLFPGAAELYRALSDQFSKLEKCAKDRILKPSDAAIPPKKQAPNLAANNQAKILADNAKVLSITNNARDVMLESRDAKIIDGDTDGEMIHVEWMTDDGEAVVGAYQLLGWTKAPKKIKSKVEAELWAPRKSRDQ